MPQTKANQTANQTVNEILDLDFRVQTCFSSRILVSEMLSYESCITRSGLNDSDGREGTGRARTAEARGLH